jgi:hypothetical protein
MCRNWFGDVYYTNKMNEYSKVQWFFFIFLYFSHSSSYTEIQNGFIIC